MTFTTFQPLLWLVPLLLALGAGWWFSLVDRPHGLKLGSFLLRILGIVFLLLALCRPFQSDEGKSLHTVFLVDVSESVALDSAIESLDSVDTSIESLEPGDSWSLFAVASGMRAFDGTEALRKTLTDWSEGIADDQFRSTSALADSLLNTRLSFPAGKAKRIILLSDGQDTGTQRDDDLAEAITTLTNESIDLQIATLKGLEKPEAAVTSVDPSTTRSFENEIVRLRVTVAANTAMKSRLRILHKGVAIVERSVDLLPRSDNRFDLDVNMTTPGPSLWTAEILPETDFFPVNNQLATTITVQGKPRVLFLHGDTREMRPIIRALREQEFDAEVRGTNGLPEAMDELLAFDAIVLANVPATSLSIRQMNLLRSFVSDFGGGLAMLGSDNSFGLGGYYKTPVEEVLPLTSRFEKEKEKPSLAMVLVIDKSGSMEGVPIQLARQAAKATVELLSGRDQIAVIGFDSQAQIISDMRSAGDKGAIQSAIDSLAAGGGTDVYPSMVVGREMLDSAPAKIKHMIILSDGQTSPADHLGLTQAMADSGITVSTVALGEGAARELMSSIAEIGRGRYYETIDPSSVPQIFTKETMQASKSAIKEDLFGSIQAGDHPILSGYEEADLPFILGYVMAEAKPTAQTLLIAETGDPLLAVSRFGLGMGMAYTSDLTENWGGEWLAWDGCGQFWAQVFRGIVKKSDTQGVRTLTSRDNDEWKITIRRSDPDGSPVSSVNWDSAVLDVNGNSSPVAIEETGLGRYEARIPLDPAKTQLSLRLHDRDSDKLRVMHYTADYPAEYRLSRGMPAAFDSVTEFISEEIRDEITPATSHRSVAHWFAFAALACLLGGMILRRI